MMGDAIPSIGNGAEITTQSDSIKDSLRYYSIYCTIDGSQMIPYHSNNASASEQKLPYSLEHVMHVRHSTVSETPI